MSKNIKKGMYMILMLGIYTVTTLGIVYLSLSLLIDGLIYAEAKRASIECQKFQDYAEIYNDFYLTESEKQQCDYYNFKINIKNES